MGLTDCSQTPEEEVAMHHRVLDCGASDGYRLWLRFEDGLEESVYLGNLLGSDAYRAWRDIEQFRRAAADRVAATVVWDAGIRFDPDILHQDLLSGISGKEFNSSGFAPAIE